MRQLYGQDAHAIDAIWQDQQRSVLLGRPTLALSFAHELYLFIYFLSIHRAQQPRSGWPEHVF